jgi:CRP-like cAMP-binding protein
VDGAVNIVDRLAQLSLFADLSRPQLESVAHTLEEQVFADGQRVLRQGLSGSAFYIILEGEASIVIDGTERARLGRGDFFGEISVLTGDPPNADVVATGILRCLTLSGDDVERFLLERPHVMLRMLKTEALRLRLAQL